MFKRFLLFTLLLMLICCAQAQTLLQALSLASVNDPEYQKALAIYQQQLQELPAARAILLPSLDLAGQINHVREYNSQLGRFTYKPNDIELNANQVVFNFEDFMKLNEARYRVKAAAKTLLSAEQDLIIRVATAYYGVLEAKQLYADTLEQRDILKKQRDASKTRFRYRDATAAELSQAQGAYQNILSELASAKITVNDRVQDLEAITAKASQHFTHLKKDLPLISPRPSRLSIWVKRAELNNLSTQAGRLQELALRQAISGSYSGFLPSVNARASYGVGREQGSATLSRSTRFIRETTLGLDFDWNLFKGGLTVSQVKTATAQYQQAVADFNFNYLDARKEAVQNFQHIIIGNVQLKSDVSAIKINHKAIQYAELAYQHGTQSLTDVIQVQTQLFDAEKQYAANVYAYLLSILRLKQAVGTLSVNDIAKANKMLVS